MKQALRTWQFWLVSALYFSYLFCSVTVMVHIIIHAIDTGLPPAIAAGIVSVIGVSQIMGMNAAGLIADRFGNKTAFTITFTCMTLAFIWLLLIARETMTFYIFAAIMGFAAGGTQVLFSPVIAEIFGLKSHGVILGTSSFFASLGAAIGAFSAGLIFDVNRSYMLAFIICGSLALLSVLWSTFIRPVALRKINNRSSSSIS